MSEDAGTGAPLPGKSLRELRARAHALKPIVRISGNGASDSVLREIDRSLDAHELIKIHAAVDGRSDREALLATICGALDASAVQIIGKMLVLYRPKREKPATVTETVRRPTSPRKTSKPGSTRVRNAASRDAGRAAAKRAVRRTR